MADRIKSLKVWWSMSAMLHQIFNDFINCNFFNRNLSFSQTNNFLVFCSRVTLQLLGVKNIPCRVASLINIFN